MDVISLKARAKINLSLDVIGRRENGYHDVRMVMQTIDLYDEISLCRESGTGEIRLNSESAAVAPDKDNLIFKAADLVKSECGIKDGVTISYRKNIPIAAGMAGGSTDAAAVFKGMNEVFSLGLSREDLCRMGVRIGADVPYCIMGGTALSEGIGEILTPLPAMPDCSILIAKPEIGVSTAYVYKAFDSLSVKFHPDVDGMIKAIDDRDINEMASLLGNSLEGVTITEYPIIKEIKDIMLGNGAKGSLMSGSGPTVFGLFSDKEEAKRAMKKMEQAKVAKDIILTGPFNESN